MRKCSQANILLEPNPNKSRRKQPTSSNNQNRFLYPKCNVKLFQVNRITLKCIWDVSTSSFSFLSSENVRSKKISANELEMSRPRLKSMQTVLFIHIDEIGGTCFEDIHTIFIKRHVKSVRRQQRITRTAQFARNSFGSDCDWLAKLTAHNMICGSVFRLA